MLRIPITLWISTIVRQLCTHVLDLPESPSYISPGVVDIVFRSVLVCRPTSWLTLPTSRGLCCFTRQYGSSPKTIHFGYYHKTYEFPHVDLPTRLLWNVERVWDMCGLYVSTGWGGKLLILKETLSPPKSSDRGWPVNHEEIYDGGGWNNRHSKYWSHFRVVSDRHPFDPEYFLNSLIYEFLNVHDRSYMVVIGTVMESLTQNSQELFQSDLPTYSFLINLNSCKKSPYSNLRDRFWSPLSRLNDDPTENLHNFFYYRLQVVSSVRMYRDLIPSFFFSRDPFTCRTLPI